MTTNNLNDTYTFVTRHTDEKQFLKIIDGPLSGAVVNIRNVKIPLRPDPDGKVRLGIDYDFVEPPMEEQETDVINQVLGEIAVDIILFHKVNFNE